MIRQAPWILGEAAAEVSKAFYYLLDTWKAGGIAIPSGKSIAHMDQDLVDKLRNRPGLVLFSSGSTGEPKAILLDAVKLVKKFDEVMFCDHPLSKRILFFMLPDHIGGINTMLHAFYSGGVLVTVKDRKPETICAAIEEHKVQVLPTTPTFLNMLILSGAHKGRDLSSLELITYGTEPMPASTLAAVREAFPNVRLKQTYGLSELGIMATKSRDDGSLWVKLGGDGYEIRIVEGLLEIKAESAMLGYLNAPSPFTEDGWFKTGDAVEVDGEWLKILGRKSEMINVGGEKVYPAEVEGILQAMPGVMSAVVSGEPNRLMGQLVKATVQLSTPETADEFRKRMRQAWKEAAFKMPIKVALASDDQITARFKKDRRCSAS